MKPVYDPAELMNLQVLKEAKHWHRQKFISTEQWSAICAAHPSKLYHPNMVIRVLLFIASWIAISGANGLFFMFISNMPKVVQALFALAGGVGGGYFARKILVENNHHFRSGVVEAIIYCAGGYVVTALGVLSNWNVHLLFLASIAVLAFLAFRYLDLICTTLGVLVLAAFIFYESYEMGGIFRQLIPFIVILCFSALYFLARQAKRDERWNLWSDNLLLTQALCLLLVYAGGNYFVVRECSVALLNMTISEGGDIPFAVIFYAFTALMPLLLIARGSQLRSLLLLRLGAATLILSVLTFRHYFSIAPPEVALTAGGVVVLLFTAWLYSYLKVLRNGFTREPLLSRAAVGAELTAFAISQTMGGNVSRPDDSFKGGGGSFGGGGASGDF